MQCKDIVHVGNTTVDYVVANIGSERYAVADVNSIIASMVNSI